MSLLLFIFFGFSHVCWSTPLTQLTSTPQICSHGIKKWIWTETRVTWCILWAEEFSSLPGLQPCRLTRWTLVPRRDVTHIKTSFLDSFTNVTLTNTKSNNLSLLSVSHLLYKGGLWGKHLLQYCCCPPTKLRRKAGVNPTWRHALVWRYCCHLHLVLAVCGAIAGREGGAGDNIMIRSDREPEDQRQNGSSATR